MNVKKMQIKSKKMKTLLNEMKLKISEDCCEKNFENKDRLLQIKINMNKCLEEECYRKGFLFYMKKPQKLLVLEQIEEATNLLLKNSKLKYANEIQIKKAKRLKAEEEQRLKEEAEQKAQAEEEQRLKEEAEQKAQAEEEQRLKEEAEQKAQTEEAKLEEISIKDQKQDTEDDKKKALHEAIERERVEKLKKIGITKRKKK